MAAFKDIEIKAELRPCYVRLSSGENCTYKKALFHKWVDKEKAIIHISEYIDIKTRNVILKEFSTYGTLPTSCDLHKIKKHLAIVEYEDGSIAEVDPKQIRFCDNKIKEYAF